MRVHFIFTRATLVLAVVWMAIGIPAGTYAEEQTSESPQVVIAEPSVPANLSNYTEYYETADTKTPAPKEAAPAVKVNCGIRMRMRFKCVRLRRALDFGGGSRLVIAAAAKPAGR